MKKMKWLNVFSVWTCISIISSNGTLLNENKICDQLLSKTRRIQLLPNLTTVPQPEPMSNTMCSFKGTCCSVKHFNAIKGQAEEFDMFIDSIEETFNTFLSNTDELLDFLVFVLSERAFALNIDISVLYARVKDDLKSLISTVDNQNVAVRFQVFMSTLIGYYTGLLCSICDPMHKLYVTLDNNEEPATAKLLLFDDMCLDMSQRFSSFLMQLENFFIDVRNSAAVNRTFDTLCKYATDPLGASTFPRQGKQGCQQMKRDYNSIRNMLVVLNHTMPPEELFGCYTPTSCAKLLCTDTLQGLGFSLNTLRHNLIESIQNHCKTEIHCHPDFLTGWVLYLFPGDDELERLGIFTTGHRVHNELVSFRNMTSLDSVRLGCGGYISRWACKVLPDVTFYTAHTKGVTIALSIIAVPIVLGLYFAYKYIQRNLTLSWGSKVSSRLKQD